MSDFDYSRYTAGGSLIDASDAYGNSGFVVSFYHLMSKKTLKFKAYITNFNETYNSDFAAEPVFGRADPIYAFRSTTRQISLAFKAPASSTGEAYENLAKAQQLVQFLYPAYTDSQNTLTIAQTPLVRMKVMNLVGNAESISLPDPDSAYSTVYDNYGPSNAPQDGLLGVLQNVTLLHNIENDQVGVFEKGNGVILPKVIEFSINFAPIHEHTIGWLEDGFSNEAFPYGAGIASDRTDAEDRGRAADEMINILLADSAEPGAGPVAEPNTALVSEVYGDFLRVEAGDVWLDSRYSGFSYATEQAEAEQRAAINALVRDD